VARLTSFWAYESFRRAVRDLLSLSETQLQRLRELTLTGFTLEATPELAERLGISVDSLGLSVAATEALYIESRSVGIDAVVRELERLIQTTEEFQEGGIEVQKKLQALADLLKPRPEYDEQARREAAEHAVFPVLEGSYFTVDLRLNRAPDGGFDLVPVVIARLWFDEEVQGGDAISFQFPPGDLEVLSEQVASLEKTLESLRRSFPKRLE
jgi:hypothetical protein